MEARALARAFYNLVEFPYPSAEGLHVGHVFKYCGADAYGRYIGMRDGVPVFQPMGWDAFGIHTENYALKVGQHPMGLTGRTTERFRAQLSRISARWDWDHAVDTSRPEYYRWTQWVFVKLFEAGLAYRAEAPVVWCPSCLTVLAREQLEGDDRCERCATVVEERRMTQWFLRITAYADRLLDGLEALDWPERAKRLQRAWIGRSEGHEIDFGETVTVFTTRADTLAGVTFVAVAPDDPRVGTTVPHPITGAPVPVCAADYVVGDYGTGAVMGVPFHDERDHRFAIEHGLPIVDEPLDPSLGDRCGRAAVRYRLRDWLISRQRYWGPPIPIVHCAACGPVAVPVEQLPVELPEVEAFRPLGTGESPLAHVASFVRAPCPACGGPGRRETDVSDTFVDSAWYFLRYPCVDRDDVPWDERARPADFYAGGPEHVQRHHLYARFVTMAMHDLGYLDFEEPFPRVRLGGLLIKDGAKMSKSRGNVIGPDEYIDRHGPDVLRCALLFTAPWEQGGDFRDDAIAGVERFFARCRKQVHGTDRVGNYVKRAGEAIERLRFNVALAAVMEGLEHFDRPTLAVTLAPLAPALAQELWEAAGRDGSVHDQRWPDLPVIEGDTVTLVVQVDGKVRTRLELARGADAEAAARAAVPGDYSRAVVIPDRLVNLVSS